METSLTCYVDQYGQLRVDKGFNLGGVVIGAYATESVAWFIVGRRVKI